MQFHLEYCLYWQLLPLMLLTEVWKKWCKSFKMLLSLLKDVNQNRFTYFRREINEEGWIKDNTKQWKKVNPMLE